METTKTQTYIPVLSIAGSDPSGGAGIQQDIKTCEAFGCYGMAAISALTAQSPKKVNALLNTAHFLKDQLSALLDEVSPFAVKTGMLPDKEAVVTTADAIEKYHLKNIVVDPVIASTSGSLLSDSGAIEALKNNLFRLATVITPNLPEAEILLGSTIKTVEDARSAAKALAHRFYAASVLIKGGHAEYSADILYVAENNSFHIFPTELVLTPNTHGTGCRLSTAIACSLALRDGNKVDIPAAVLSAKEWLTDDLLKNSTYRFPKF